jgi:hypothetical protein
MKDIEDYPVLRGNTSDDENDDTYWGEWEKTSQADRETYEKVASDSYWMSLESVDSFDYREYLDSSPSLWPCDDMISYVDELVENHFIFEYDFRHKDDSKPRYRDELKARKLIVSRDEKLNKLI